jgi:hypothetical protein
MMSADDALQRLIAGNERFLRGASRFPRIQKEILADLAKGQQREHQKAGGHSSVWRRMSHLAAVSQTGG